LFLNVQMMIWAFRGRLNPTDTRPPVRQDDRLPS
jgi:hypothetical protein